MFRRRLNRKFGWIWLFLLAFLAIHAQAQLPPPPPIHRIVITNIGPQTVSDSLVRANMRVKEGDPYVRANVDDDVRNLYATGFFSDIRVKDEVTADGVDLHYYLRSKLKLTEINFVGNKKYSSRKLRKSSLLKSAILSMNGSSSWIRLKLRSSTRRAAILKPTSKPFLIRTSAAAEQRSL